MFQLRAHKLAKAQAAAKHPGSQECSNRHTSSPRGKQQRQAQQSTQAHKHVPTAGTQARQGASSGKASRLTSMFQLRAHKLAKAHAAAKHPGSQECSNGHTSSPRRKQRQSTQAHKSVPTGTQARQGACSGKHPGSQECPNGHTSLPGRMQRQCTKAHKSVPTGTQACQGACSGKAPRLTRVFQRAHKLARAHAAAKHQGSQECSNGHASSPRGKQCIEGQEEAEEGAEYTDACVLTVHAQCTHSARHSARRSARAPNGVNST